MIELHKEVIQDITDFIFNHMVVVTPEDVSGEKCIECEMGSSCGTGCDYMQITFATDDTGTSWNYQTGDNSFSGGCYSLPHWSVHYVSKDTDLSYLVSEVLNGLTERLPENI